MQSVREKTIEARPIRDESPKAAIERVKSCWRVFDQMGVAACVRDAMEAALAQRMLATPWFAAVDLVNFVYEKLDEYGKLKGPVGRVGRDVREGKLRVVPARVVAATTLNGEPCPELTTWFAPSEAAQRAESQDLDEVSADEALAVSEDPDDDTSLEPVDIHDNIEPCPELTTWFAASRSEPFAEVVAPEREDDVEPSGAPESEDAEDEVEPCSELAWANAGVQG